MSNKAKFDRRRKYFVVLDCETATLPFAAEYHNAEIKKNIAIAKPLIYDLGWQIIDRTGKVYAKKNYLISEIFSVPAVFNTAYYASKRPIYLEMLETGLISLTNWDTAVNELMDDLQYCEAVGAYNAMFDFKKAIPFTERYIRNLYSDHYYEWERNQHKICDSIASGEKIKNEHDFNKNAFVFKDKSYPLFDLWAMSCERLINNDDYKQMCIDQEWSTKSGKYFPTTAEYVYAYLTDNTEFIESHTALDDARIESEIFAAIVKGKIKNLDIGITYFPFRILGTVDAYMGM